MKLRFYKLTLLYLMTSSLAACQSAAPGSEATATLPPPIISTTAPTISPPTQAPSLDSPAPTNEPTFTPLPTAEPAQSTPTQAVVVSGPAWLDIPLSDVRTGATFKLSDYAGKVVILEPMAVWCPKCLAQQHQISAALNELGDKAIAVSVDIDTSEDAALLASHANTHGLSWPFAIAPNDLRQALVNEYGPAILSAPSTPIIIIDPSGIPHLTDYGIKDAASLTSLVNQWSLQ
jgi:thiol-disulfide isomerase/thioredoxin